MAFPDVDTHPSSLSLQTFPKIMSLSLPECEVSSNQLSKSIPEALGSLSAIHSVLGLSENRFTGSIPEILGRLPLLQLALLGDNHLSGPLPAAFDRLPRLQQLGCASNYLSGLKNARTTLGRTKSIT